MIISGQIQSIAKQIKEMNGKEQEELKALLKDEGVAIDFSGRVFQTNKLVTETDGLTGVNYYIIYAEHEVKSEDGRGAWWDTELTEIDRILMTWDDIEQEGGNGEWLRQLKEEYNL